MSVRFLARLVCLRDNRFVVFGRQSFPCFDGVDASFEQFPGSGARVANQYFVACVLAIAVIIRPAPEGTAVVVSNRVMRLDTT